MFVMWFAWCGLCADPFTEADKIPSKAEHWSPSTNGGVDQQRRVGSPVPGADQPNAAYSSTSFLHRSQDRPTPEGTVFLPKQARKKPKPYQEAATVVTEAEERLRNETTSEPTEKPQQQTSESS